MSYPYIGEIRIISFSFAPKGWSLCNGGTLPINMNQALFSILGTTYGGNGVSTFALPDMQGRVPVHAGGTVTAGQKGGESTHTLIASELPAHNHSVGVDNTTGGANTGSPNGAYLTNSAPTQMYSTSSNATMDPAMLGYAGGSQPHENMSPYFVLNYIICTVGIFPSR